MPLRILKTNVDGLTGHVQHEIRIEETVDGHTTYGPVETVGIWPRALVSKFHDANRKPCHESMCDAHRKWLCHHHDAALERKRHLDLIHNSAKTFQDQLIDPDDNA